MKKDVLIRVSSSQEYADVGPDAIDFMTDGRLYTRDGKLYVSYEESQLTGLEGTRTTLKIEQGQATLLRTGTLASQMLFIEGQRHVGLYPTPYGAMTIATHTSSIDNQMTEDGGKIAINYTIEIDNRVAGTNAFIMQVAPKDMDKTTLIGDFKI